MEKALSKPTSIQFLRKLVQNYRKTLGRTKPEGNPVHKQQTKYVWISEKDLRRLLDRCKAQYGIPDEGNREAGIKFYFGCYGDNALPHDVDAGMRDNFKGLLTLASVGCMKIKKAGKFVYKDAVSRRKPKENEEVYQRVAILDDGDEGDNHGHMCPPSCDSSGDDDDIFCCLENELGCDPNEDCIEVEPGN